MARGINKKSINFRYNIATIFTYLIGIILIVQLFNLQIVHGAKYREESNTRLTRESVLEADRGEILDRSGNVLVSSSQKFNLELYKSKIDTDTLNESILKIIQVLEKYDAFQQSTITKEENENNGEKDFIESLHVGVPSLEKQRQNSVEFLKKQEYSSENEQEQPISLDTDIIV